MAAKEKNEKRIGDYVIVDKPLGYGGMATVYKVKNSKGKFFAAKVLHQHLVKNRKVVMRFKQEFEIGKKLKNSAFVKMHEYVKADGVWCIIMEYVPGLTIHAILGMTTFNEIEATAVVCQISNALAYFHKFNLIHRDLKPGNLMINPKGEVKIMDYGITRDHDQQMTKTGTAVGTPLYMSPEQLAGEKKLTSSCDIYSIGLIYYRLLTNRDPQGLGATSDYFVTVDTRLHKPVKSSKYISDPEILKVIEKTMQIKPENRYLTTMDLVKDLKNLKSFSKSTKPILQDLNDRFEEMKYSKLKKRKTDVFVVKDQMGFPKKLKIMVFSLGIIALIAILLTLRFNGWEESLSILKSVLSF